MDRVGRTLGSGPGAELRLDTCLFPSQGWDAHCGLTARLRGNVIPSRTLLRWSLRTEKASLVSSFLTLADPTRNLNQGPLNLRGRGAGALVTGSATKASVLSQGGSTGAMEAGLFSSK